MRPTTRLLMVLALISAISAISIGPAVAAPDVCVTYDFAGSEFCVVEDTIGAPPTVDPEICITYDFAGSELCVIETVTGQNPLPPWLCVIYDSSGNKICVIRNGEINPGS